MKILQAFLKLFPTQQYVSHLWHSLLHAVILGTPLFIWLCLLTHTIAQVLATLLFILFSHHAQQAVLSHCAELVARPHCAQLASSYTSLFVQWTVLFLLSFRQLRFFLFAQHRHMCGSSLLGNLLEFEACQMFLMFASNIVFTLADKVISLLDLNWTTLLVLRLWLVWKVWECARRSPSLSDCSVVKEEKTDAGCLYSKREKLKFVTCSGLRFYCRDDFD